MYTHIPECASTLPAMLKPALLTSSATFKPNRVAPSLLEAEESDWRLVGTGQQNAPLLIPP